MKRMLISMLAMAFPWVILLMDDNPLGAFFAIILQCTVIGWIPASVWAYRITTTSSRFQSYRTTKPLRHKSPHKDNKTDLNQTGD